MRFLNALAVCCSLMLCSVFLAPNVSADVHDKQTTFTFSQPVSIPGTTLPAGTYMFRLMESQSDRDIVQVFDQNGRQLYATVLAIPDYHPNDPAQDTIIMFEERPAGSPQAIKAWFFPGDTIGQEFVYPERQATALAAANNQNVPSVAENTEASNLKTAPLSSAAAQNQQAAVSEPAETQPQAAPENNQTPASNDQTAENKPLPKTASVTPLVALLGGISLAAGCGLALFRRSTTKNNA